MLTPVDEPLDKLEDLTPEEMLVIPLSCRRLCLMLIPCMAVRI